MSVDPAQAKAAKEFQDLPAFQEQNEKFKANLKEINRIDTAPAFRKSYSTLTNLTPFIDVTLEIPIIPPAALLSATQAIAQGRQSDSPAQLGEVELFRIPYNNIKSIDFEAGPGGAGTLVFSDSSFAFGQALMMRLSSAVSGDNPTVKIRYGWNQVGSPRLSNRSVRPVYESVFYASVQKTDISVENTKEVYTLTFNRSHSGPIGGTFQSAFRPFQFLGHYPLMPLALGKVFALWKETYGKTKTSNEAPKLAKELSEALASLGKDNIDTPMKQTIKAIVDHYGVKDQNSIRVIIESIDILLKDGLGESIQLQPTEGISTKEDLFTSYLLDKNINFTGITGDNLFQTISGSPEKNKETLNSLCSKLAIAKSELIHPYIAFLFLLKQMIIHNELINNSPDSRVDQKNKIVFLNFVDEKQISNLDQKAWVKNPPGEYLKKAKSADGLKQPSDFPSPIVKSWTELISDVASSITLEPGKITAAKGKPAAANNSRSVTVTANTFRKKGSKDLDIKAFKDNMEILIQTRSIKDKSLGGKDDAIVKFKKTLDDFIDDPTYGQLTLIIISDGDTTHSPFALTSYRNRIIQTYSVFPEKRPKATVFNSGSTRMVDGNFPDVISFTPKMDFNGGMNLKDMLQGSTNKSAVEGSMTLSKEEKERVQTGKLIVENLVSSSKVFFSTNDNFSFNSAAYSYAYDSFAIELAKKAHNVTAELKIIGEPALDGLVSESAALCVYVKMKNPNGTTSPYTGLYTINGNPKMSIEGGKFTTTMNLRRNTAVDVRGDLFGNKAVMEITAAPAVIEKEPEKGASTNKSAVKAAAKKEAKSLLDEI